MRKPNIMLFDSNVFKTLEMTQSIDQNQVSLSVFNQAAPFVDQIREIDLGALTVDVIIIGHVKAGDVGKICYWLEQLERLQTLRQEGKLILINVGNTKPNMNPDLFNINFFIEKEREFVPKNDMPKILAEALGLLNDEVRRELEVPEQMPEEHLQQI